MGAILRKDLGEHAWALIPVGLCTGVILLVLWGLVHFPPLAEAFGEAPFFSALPRPQDALSGLTLFVLACLPLTWVLVNRLVVWEYVHHGWDCLETLPIGRGRILGTKALFGAICLGGLLLVGWSGFVLVSGDAALTDREAALALEGAAAALLGVYAYAFAAATTGRHRFAVHLVVVTVLVLVELDPRELPRLDVLGRKWFTTLVLSSAGLLVVGCVLATARGGAWARAWQGVPSARVRSAILVASLLVLGGWGQRIETPTFQLRGTVAKAPGVEVRVPAPEHRERAQALASDLSDRLQVVETKLDLTRPTVAVEHGPTLDGQTWERAELSGLRGLLVRTNYLAPSWKAKRFEAWLLREVIDLASEGRLRSGPWRLLLDGLPRWSVGDPGDELRAAWGVRALERAGEPLSAESIARWDLVRSRVGDAVARALAHWVLTRLEASVGEDAVWALGRAACAERRSAWGGWQTRSRFSELLTLHTDRSVGELADSLNSEALLLQREHATALARLPDLERRVLEVDSDGALEFEAGPGPGRWVLMHGEVEGLQTIPSFPDRDEAPAGRRSKTAKRYPSGTRVKFAFAVWVPELACDLVFGWDEVRIP